jgi:predicted amidohydrolase
MRYAAAACQVDFSNPTDRAGIRDHTDRMLALSIQTVEGYGPFCDVRLLTFPEFAHAAPIYPTAKELRKRLTVPIPNEHTERYGKFAAEYDVFIQTGTFLEEDPDWPGAVFNTTCLIGPDGILAKYRKTHPWIPFEVHASPHDLEGYEDDPFPVADTPIGKIGAAICYDWLFPEPIRMLAMNGAEILVRVSAYMDPWGATAPMDWWTVVNRCRAIENTAYVVASNQGASDGKFPPFSWPGGSMVVDPDGIILAQADPGPGEKVVVAEIDLAALRAKRERRRGHDMIGHMRTELYRGYGKPMYPGGTMNDAADNTFDDQEARIDEARRRREP